MVCAECMKMCCLGGKNLVVKGLNFMQAVQKLFASGPKEMQVVKTICKRFGHASGTKLHASGLNSCLVPNQIEKLELGPR